MDPEETLTERERPADGPGHLLLVSHVSHDTALTVMSGRCSVVAQSQALD
jgi:hypothetical protein